VRPSHAAESRESLQRARAHALRGHGMVCATRKACRLCVGCAPSRTSRPESLPVQDLIEEGLLISASMLRHHKINTMGRALEAAENVAREHEQD